MENVYATSIERSENDSSAWPSSYYGLTRRIDLAKLYHDILLATQTKPVFKPTRKCHARRVSFSTDPPTVHEYEPENDGHPFARLDRLLMECWPGRQTAPERSPSLHRIEENKQDMDTDHHDDDPEGDFWVWDKPLTSQRNHLYVRRHHSWCQPHPPLDLRPILNDAFNEKFKHRLSLPSDAILPPSPPESPTVSSAYDSDDSEKQAIVMKSSDPSSQSTLAQRTLRRMCIPPFRSLNKAPSIATLRKKLF
ncbi:uncharacterized protein BYT42DRAFT_569111 [Radiomyces spectabilis]|uniref:uncharacterized protein n=1 Tax=Radiomyces spectabilis TaxID=64574 RepID=UPI00221F4A2B|nr:uncharacterized protein BYT42DRAFT_569111 [Radiomyces spectabilis]KAI8379538.1 hypothetical protein BYT42DRAFT_569111 [Radiomyces spectabilis]